MEEEFIVHDAIQTLYEHNKIDKEGQEECLKRYSQPEFIVKLENLLEEYNVGYDCDFKELQKRVLDQVKNYEIKD